MPRVYGTSSRFVVVKDRPGVWAVFQYIPEQSSAVNRPETGGEFILSETFTTYRAARRYVTSYTGA